MIYVKKSRIVIVAAAFFEKILGSYVEGLQTRSTKSEID